MMVGYVALLLGFLHPATSSSPPTELSAEVVAASLAAGEHHTRRLSGGAMDELNRLLADIVFNIPDQDFTIVTPKIAIDDIDTKLRSTTCHNLGIGDVLLNARKPSEQ